MPRVDPRLIRKAHTIHPHLARLLPVCRDLHSARRELRWMRDHAKVVFKESSPGIRSRGLQHFVGRRSRGEPLQYILGSEFFGDLEIQCRPGVLIPRQETAASVTNLVHLLSSNQNTLPSRLRVLDLCTGTGCIPLLFHHEFHKNMRIPRSSQDAVILDLRGVDISPSALSLAEENRRRYLSRLISENGDDGHSQRSLRDAKFLKADVLVDTAVAACDRMLPLLEALRQHERSNKSICDILISNPPYISTVDYWRNTSPSVRRYEPMAALVPSTSGNGTRELISGADIFYRSILHIAKQAEVRIALLEVADLAQAKRVADIAIDQGAWTGVEIWRDDPSSKFSPSSTEEIEDRFDCHAMIVPILGAGNGRSVLVYRGNGIEWLGRMRTRSIDQTKYNPRRSLIL